MIMALANYSPRRIANLFTSTYSHQFIHLNSKLFTSNYSPQQPQRMANFLLYFLGFEGFTRLECDISWVQNEDEVKTKVFLKSSNRLHLPFKRGGADGRADHPKQSARPLPPPEGRWQRSGDYSLFWMVGPTIIIRRADHYSRADHHGRSRLFKTASGPS